MAEHARVHASADETWAVGCPDHGIFSWTRTRADAIDIASGHDRLEHNDA